MSRGTNDAPGIPKLAIEVINAALNFDIACSVNVQTNELIGRQREFQKLREAVRRMRSHPEFQTWTMRSRHI